MTPYRPLIEAASLVSGKPESLLRCLTEVHTAIGARRADSKRARGFSYGYPLAADNNETVVPSISVLVSAWRPAVVARFVIAVVVDALDCVARRAWTHVANKSAVVVSPLRAHGDSAESVVDISLIGSRETSPLGVLPALIFAGRVAITPSAMRCIQLADQLGVQTAATLGGAAPDGASVRYESPAAVASTNPQRFATRRIVASDNDQSAESLSGDVYKLHSQSYNVAVDR